jgi:hypothetical protein
LSERKEVGMAHKRKPSKIQQLLEKEFSKTGEKNLGALQEEAVIYGRGVKNEILRGL